MGKGELQQQERLSLEVQAKNCEAYVKPFNQRSLMGP